ncbi:hypothetical protein LSH36_7g19001 [Paralvinella palmiformis]|uniref:Cadherin domain-containing protein n=1 Tax=Paralvinella palmiformis TaxID=53620 RepID=A0AAD9NII3_9ANNE|nr:hypothetical protein LSH36_7g19001 [Paralvinella palmiformis]
MGSILFMWFLCLWWSLTATANNSTSDHQRPLPYYLLEELPANTLIGNVVVDAKLSDKYPAGVMGNLSYHIFKQVNERGVTVGLFDVDQSTGILKTAVRIDRDEICPKKENCLIYLDIMVYPPQYYHLIETVVDVLDINDHVPTFAESEVFLRVTESARPGAILDLPEAADPDGADYGIEHYELVSSTSKFELRTNSLPQPTDIKLVIKEKLDCKEANFYQFRLVAYDGGEPPKFGSVLINIEIIHDLDNGDDGGGDGGSTKLDNATYEIFVLENTPLGTTIGKISGKDLNFEHNATLYYRFTESTNQSYGQLFGIVHHTGGLFLKRTLDYEITPKYVLSVAVSDDDSMPLPTHVRIIVQVEDDNDHAPEITVDTQSPSGEATISEKANTGTFVAKVSVNDADENENGKVRCLLDGAGSFQILESGVQEYQILTAIELTRDLPRSQNLKIMCHDLGKNPMSSTAEVTVTLTKANYSPPSFSKTTYTATIVENNQIGETVAVVHAADPDEGQNGEVRYKLQNDIMDMFSVHPTSGILTTNIVLDHENTRTMDIKVVAFDLGMPVSLSATATVLLTVIDVDDEIPEFTQEFFAFGTFENQPPGADVGVVTANDDDSPPYNQFTYHLIGGTDDAVDLFSMNSLTGHIYTKLALDRETRPVYYMTAMVRSLTDLTHTSTASVTIYVADKNDNKPTITWPTESNNTVYISDKLPPNTEVARVRAFDGDLGSNGKLAYSIRGGGSDLFAVDLATGVLTTKPGVSLSTYDAVDLVIQVKDHGFPRLSSASALHVIINSSVSYAGSRRPMNVIYTNNNTTIIVSLTSASLILIFLLIVAIVLIKKQQQEKKAKSYANNVQPNTMASGRLESQTMLAVREDAPDGRESCGAECLGVREQNLLHASLPISAACYTEHRNGCLQMLTDETDNILDIKQSEPNLQYGCQNFKNPSKLKIPDVVKELDSEQSRKQSPMVESLSTNPTSLHGFPVGSMNNFKAPVPQEVKGLEYHCNSCLPTNPYSSSLLMANTDV